jgi:hypothetical protein
VPAAKLFLRRVQEAETHIFQHKNFVLEESIRAKVEDEADLPGCGPKLNIPAEFKLGTSSCEVDDASNLRETVSVAQHQSDECTEKRTADPDFNQGHGADRRAKAVPESEQGDMDTSLQSFDALLARRYHRKWEEHERARRSHSDGEQIDVAQARRELAHWLQTGVLDLRVSGLNPQQRSSRQIGQEPISANEAEQQGINFSGYDEHIRRRDESIEAIEKAGPAEALRLDEREVRQRHVNIVESLNHMLPEPLRKRWEDPVPVSPQIREAIRLRDQLLDRYEELISQPNPGSLLAELRPIQDELSVVNARLPEAMRRRARMAPLEDEDRC